jgi:phosphohistidine phosphatase
MRIYLVQHGEAVDKAENPDRPLSTQGVEDVRKLAAFMARAGVAAGRVIHSGKLRAAQTAEILAGAALPGGAPLARSGLGPKDAVAPIVRELEGSDESVMLVGHMPFVAAAVDELIASDSAGPAVAYRPGSLVCLERDQAGHWSIAWMLRPEIL